MKKALKFASTLLAGILTFSFVACANDDDSNNSENTTPPIHQIPQLALQPALA